MRAGTPCLLTLVLFLGLAGCGPQNQEQALTPLPGPRGPAPIRVSPDAWVLSTDTWDGEYRGTYLGNGYLGQRFKQVGTGLSGEGHEPAYMAGLYAQESLVTLSSFLPLQLRANGEVFGGNPSRITGYRQELRLREGTLVTRGSWDPGGGAVQIELEAALLRHQPDLALLRVKVENRGGGPVAVGVPEEGMPDSAGDPVLSAPGTFAVDAGHGVSYTGSLQPLDRQDLRPGPVEGFRLAYEVPAGQTVQLALVTHVRGGTPFVKNRLPVLPTVTAAQVETWLEGHRKAWERLWARDIEIEGDPEAQQVVRACLFYLLGSIREENHGGMPPMGLSANAFNGHVFWDMDSWMFPALLPQHPDLGRAMLEYRYRTLDGARANARAEGLPGASFAWESGRSGEETLKVEVFRHGRHVSGDVALALRQYYHATGDRAWLQARAWPILKATADNWAARARPDDKGGFVVRGITTPDENAGQVDHSAWTHHVARANLEFAAEAGRTLGQPVDPNWEKVAKGLSFLRDPETKLILSYAGFNATKKAKQADALLLAHPGELDLPRDELGRMYDFYAPRVIDSGPAMTDAIHAIIAARLGKDEEALTRFRQSYRPFVRPPFHFFSEKRTRDNLCFLTGAAGVVEAVLYGFAGLRLESAKEQPDRPTLEPHLPAEWKTLRLHGLQWRGKSWNVELKPDATPVWTPLAG